MNLEQRTPVEQAAQRGQERQRAEEAGATRMQTSFVN